VRTKIRLFFFLFFKGSGLEGASTADDSLLRGPGEAMGIDQPPALQETSASIPAAAPPRGRLTAGLPRTRPKMADALPSTMLIRLLLGSHDTHLTHPFSAMVNGGQGIPTSGYWPRCGPVGVGQTGRRLVTCQKLASAS